MLLQDPTYCPSTSHTFQTWKSRIPQRHRVCGLSQKAARAIASCPSPTPTRCHQRKCTYSHTCVSRAHTNCMRTRTHARTPTHGRARKTHTHTQAIPKTEQWPIALEHLMQASLSNRQPPPQLPQDCHHEFAEFRRFVFETAHRYNKMQMARSHPVAMLDACCAASLALLASVRVYTCIFSYAYTYI